MLMKDDLSRIFSKWVVELKQFNIKFLPKAANKVHVLADFIFEFSSQTMSPKAGYLDFARMGDESSVVTSAVTEIIPAAKNIPKDPKVLQEPPQINQSKAWKMYMDGAKNNLRASAGVVLKCPE